MLLKYFFSLVVGLVGLGGKMNSRIRLSSVKVGVEVEAELCNKVI